MAKQNTKETSSDIPISFNRVLGFWDLTAIAVGLIVGAGVITLTGSAIAETGRSVFISFIIATIIMAISNIPFMYIGGTIRMEGGQYTQMGMFAPKFITGIYIWTNFFAVISLAMYGISFGMYLLELVPGLNMDPRLIGFIVLSIMYLINFFGIKGMAKLEILLVVAMSIALTVFVCFGLDKVVPPSKYFEKSQFLVNNNVMGIFVAAAMLTFATDGAKYIINLSGECKNPTKDIPRVMTISTIVVGIIYTLVGVVASGVLPISTFVDNKNATLATVAHEIMPHWLYVFFIICGALLALVTTVNATIGYMTKPIVLACRDGWLPKKLSVLHKKFKTPWAILILCYAVSCLPLCFKIDMDTIANSTIVLLRMGLALLCFYMIRLPKVIPDIWARSAYHVSDKKLKFVAILTGLLSLFQVVILIVDAAEHDPMALYANIVFLALAVILAAMTYKHADITISYEECNKSAIANVENSITLNNENIDGDISDTHNEIFENNDEKNVLEDNLNGSDNK